MTMMMMMTMMLMMLMQMMMMIICVWHVIHRRACHMLPWERVSHGTQGKIKQKLHFHKVHNNNDWLHAGSAKDPASRPQQ